MRRFFKYFIFSFSFLWETNCCFTFNLQRSSGRGPVPPRLRREDGEGGVEGREEGLDRRGGGGGIIFWLRSSGMVGWFGLLRGHCPSSQFTCFLNCWIGKALQRSVS